MIRSFATIFDACGTDKQLTHGYGPLYDKLFPKPMRETVRNVLEIGVYKGQSLLAWHEAFPNARIFGVDMEPRFTGDGKKIATINANILDAAAVKGVSGLGPFDLIVDDASHRLNEQIATMQALWPALAVGGVYVIEEFAYWEYHRANDRDKGLPVVRIKV